MVRKPSDPGIFAHEYRLADDDLAWGTAEASVPVEIRPRSRVRVLAGGLVIAAVVLAVVAAWPGRDPAGPVGAAGGVIGRSFGEPNLSGPDPGGDGGDGATTSTAYSVGPVDTAGGSSPVTPVLPSDPGAARRFATLEDAQKAGVVDGAVLTQLGAGGLANALVVLDRTEALTASTARGVMPGSPEAMTPYAAALRPIKDQILALGVPVVRDFEYLAILYLQFQSVDQVLQVANHPKVVRIAANTAADVTG